MTETVVKPGLRERKKQQVRERILATAERLFRQQGYAGTSMDEIAEQTEISRKTLFNHMASKEAILTALVDELVRRNMPDWVEPDEPVHGDARDVVAPRLRQRIQTIAANRWLLELAAAHTNYFNSVKSELVDRTLHSNFEARTRRIAAVQALGRIRKDISAAEISGYYEVLRDATIQRWLLTPDSTARALQRDFDNAMKVLLRGLDPAPASYQTKGK